jgi:hypothetical protein
MSYWFAESYTLVLGLPGPFYTICRSVTDRRKNRSPFIAAKQIKKLRRANCDATEISFFEFAAMPLEGDVEAFDQG